ncbi:type II secretion system protein GspD [Candidatus Margulisiibacteriota bacterium]
MKKFTFILIVLLFALNTSVLALSLPFKSLFKKTAKQSEYIIIVSPTNNYKTLEDKIVIAGTVNKKVRFLFIGNDEIKFSKKRDFEAAVDLPKYGTYNLELKAYLNKNEFFTKKLNITRFRHPHAPILKLSAPVKDFSSNKGIVLFKGTVSKATRLKINGINIPIKNNQFSRKFILTKEGRVNNFSIIAYSKNGIKTKLLRNILYKPEIKKIKSPFLKIFQPLDNLKSLNKKVIIKGKTAQAKYLFVNNIPVKINRNGRFIYPAILIKENQINTFYISAVSKKGEVNTIIRNIWYKAPLKPKFTEIFPKSGTTISEQNSIIKGKVAKTAKLLINGKSVNLKKDGTFSYPIKVLTTKNYQKYILTAVSKDKIAISKTIKLLYKPKKVPKIKPELLTLFPNDGYISYQKDLKIMGSVKNTKTILVNGKKVIPNKRGLFIYPVSFKKENERKTITVKIFSKDNIGIQKRISIIYKELKIPSITIFTPEENLITNKSKLKIAGEIKNASQFFINDNKIELNKNGSFTYFINLTKNNAYTNFKLKAISKDSEISKQIKVFYKKSDKSPIISITSPKNNSITAKNKIMIKGFAQNTALLTINSQRVDLKKDGSFSVKKNLSRNNDYNFFKIKGTAPDKSTQLISLKIYKKVPNAPKIMFENPLKAKSISKSKNIQIIGKAKNTTYLKINGKSIYFSENGDFKHNLSLKKGSNKITVTATFENRSVTKNLLVEYVPAVIIPSPKIKIITPRNNHISRKNNILIKGQVLNADTLYINNQKIPLNKNGYFYKKFNLKPKAYSHFKLKAYSTTKKEKAELALKVYYKPTIKKIAKKQTKKSVTTSTKKIPRIKLMKPEPNFVTYDENITFAGSIVNAKELFINDKKIPLDSNGSFNFDFPIKDLGKNIFNLYAIGKKGTHSSLAHFVYRTAKPRKNEASTRPLSKVERSLSHLQEKENKLNEKLSQNISLELVDADIKYVLRLLAKKGSLNIVADKTLVGSLDISLSNITLKNAIDLVLNSQGISYKIVENTILVAAPTKLVTPTTLKTMIIKLNNINSSDVQKVLSEHISAQEKIQSVEQDNLLIINADYKKIDKLVAIAKRIDQEKVPQIMLEARIIETSTAVMKGLGISWPQSLGIGADMTYSTGQTTVQSNTSISALVKFLEETAQGKVLARPNIKTLNNKEASIFIGDNIPYTETTIDPTGKISESIKFVDSGIKLKVKPAINQQKGEIIIEIEPEVSFIYGWRGKNSDIPWVKTRKVQTTVSLKDGETVIIGGLFNSTDTDNSTKIPLLGEIPLLGNLFRGNKTDKSESQLIITITPKIVSDKVQTTK